MAEELDVTLEEAQPDADLESDASMTSRKWYIIIPVALLILAAQTVAAYYTINLIFFSNMPSLPDTASMTSSDSTEAEPEETSKEPYKATGEIYEFQDIIVNPSGTMGRRYLVVSMSFEVSHKRVLEELNQQEPILRDALLTLLARKSLDYVADVSNLEAIREEIMVTANSYLADGSIIRIFFTGYILQ